jgi:hypothetical protein
MSSISLDTISMRFNTVESAAILRMSCAQLCAEHPAGWRRKCFQIGGVIAVF